MANIKIKTLKRLRAYRDAQPEGGLSRKSWDAYVMYAEATREAPNLTADQWNSLLKIHKAGGMMSWATITHCFLRDVTLMLRKGDWLETANGATVICLSDMASWYFEHLERLVKMLDEE